MFTGTHGIVQFLTRSNNDSAKNTFIDILAFVFSSIETTATPREERFYRRYGLLMNSYFCPLRSDGYKLAECHFCCGHHLEMRTGDTRRKKSINKDNR